jgi:hypothetical protein
MVFIIITLLSVLGLVFWLTNARYAAKPPAPGKKADYFSWLWAGIRGLFKKEAFKKGQKFLDSWVNSYYPGWTKWIFWAFAASFVYQAASGFFFAVFSPRGMFGIPLLLHVSVGGLFAVSLAMMLILRARAYRLDQEEDSTTQSFAHPPLKNISKSLLRKILFWLFAAAGLCLIATALGSMVPVFSFETQQSMIDVHRYSALIALLTASIFLDIAYFPQPQAK